MRARTNQSHFLLLFNKVYGQAHTGCSVNINKLNSPPIFGYMVGIKNVGVYDSIQSVIAGEVIDSIKQYHTGSNKNYLGIWSDSQTGKVYFDISIWIETLELAKQIGTNRNEIAIWDLKNNNEIIL